MKEATGELNMTVITVIAIAAVAGLFYTLVWPTIQRSIVNNTCSTYGEGWHAVRRDSQSQENAKLNGENAANQRYGCCKSSVSTWSSSANDCVQ